jgi:DNA polymerase-3 subunit beta
MKLVIQKERFLEGLQLVQNVVSSRSTLPILNNVLIKSDSGHVSLATTDLDTSIRTSAEAQVEKPGSITLPVKRLVSIVRELPVSEFTLETDDQNGCSIKAGNSFFRIMGLPEGEFPPLPKDTGAKVFELGQKAFKDMLRKIAYAMSTDESRYVLNGSLLSFKDNKLSAVATDGRRLALVEQELEIPQSSELDAILPTKAVNELLRILQDEGNVRIAVSENQIFFTIGSTFLSSKLIDGNYPNYKQVIPGEVKERVTIERELLLSSVRRVALLSSDKTNSVKLHFAKNSLEITANTPDVGEARESLAIQYKGKEFTIAFNPEFLCDPLRSLDTDTVFLDLIDELSQAVIRYSKPFLYVIMPMRTA